MVKKILWGIIIFLLIGITLVIYINKDTISLIYNAYFVSSENLQEKNKETKENLVKTLEDTYGLDKIKEVVGSEDEEAFLRGDISKEEFKEITEAKKEEDKKTQNETVTNNWEEICKNAVNNAINEMYYIKTDYLIELKGIEGEIARYYNSLMTQEGMTKTKAKLLVAQNYTKTMLNFQKHCDDSVNTILTDLEKVLKNNGGDTSVIKQIKNEYDNMKKEKLAQYTARYNKK